jgi:tetratricopeptide (TPR) repeat protein
VGRYDEALRESNRAIELSPLDIFSHANVGTLLALMQHYDSSMEHFDKALQLDPRQQYTYERLGAVLLWQGKNERAIEMFQKAADLTNRLPEKLAWLGYAYAISGKRKEALDVLDEIKWNPRRQYVSPFYMGLLYMGLGDKENAIRSLKKAYTDHDEWMVYLNTYPEFAGLHQDARFQDLERRVGLLKEAATNASSEKITTPLRPSRKASRALYRDRENHLHPRIREARQRKPI